VPIRPASVNAYSEPYQEMNEGLEVIWDESSAEAVAKLRAMDEAGNVTWDLVDVVAADAIRLCDEGLAMEIDHDEMLAPAPDGTPASEDFGDLIVSDCFIPQIVYSTTFGYRTDMVGRGRTPTTSATCSTWKPSRASARWKAPDQQHGMGAAL
jgi:putative spermidine/putrescine transport system substrate-binding protein